jgi:soluble lytic murein transglycosylase
MRRLFTLIACLAATLFTLTSQAASLNQQRQWYDAARTALQKGNDGPYRRHAEALRAYPLEPYLAYESLNRRLGSASNRELGKFFTEHGDLPQAGRLKLRWLRLLAERRDWQPFLDHYDPQLELTELDCLYGRYLLESGLQEAGQAQAERLWLVGTSQPDECDGLFRLWSRQGGLTEDLRWQRLRLAALAGNLGLATHLASELSTLRADGQLLLEVARTPERLSQDQRFVRNDPRMAEIVGLGLRRLARRDPERALELLDTYAPQLSFPTEEKLAIARDLGLRLARRFDSRALRLMADYDPELRDATLTEWRMRLLLRLERWEEAHQLTRRLDGDLAQTNRWRYWRARSLQLSQGDTPEALQLYLPVSAERDFYGFLAADRIGQPYRIGHQPLEIDPKILQRVRNSAGIRRAMEFYQRGQIVDARREWYHVSRLFSREELIAQAKLAHDMDWYFPAIRTISLAQHWDDLDIRFPMAYRSSLVRTAQQRGVESSWVYAITRQESGFMDDARSHVGATGLMQVMPTTARETARRFGIALKSNKQILDPDLNIQLGTAYLSQVHRQFGHNRILATAAYNAGPKRVRQWLKNTQELDFDVWVESLPYDETRQYVQNVLTYAVIYGDKLGAPQSLVEGHERVVKP